VEKVQESFSLSPALWAATPERSFKISGIVIDQRCSLLLTAYRLSDSIS